jgi:nicotinamide mononucleotide (NMN) deamidase PncC
MLANRAIFAAVLLHLSRNSVSRCGQKATRRKPANARRCVGATAGVFSRPLAGKLTYVSASPSLIERIHAAGKPLVLAVTGGGSGAISGLLEVPGASGSVLEVVVPYASATLADWLGGTPEQYCSERTARAMAMAAFERARQLTDADPLSLRGIGATASLATTRPKRGPHRIHVAWQSAEATVVTSYSFPSELSRADEEPVAARVIIDAVAEACGVERPQLGPTIRNSLKRREMRAQIEWTELLLGRRQCVDVWPMGADSTSRSSNREHSTPLVLFPGAFNPLHSGHQRMAEVAADHCRREVTFELSITNVDKPPLDFVEIADRLRHFKSQHVLLTRAPTFVEKAAIAPGCTFVVGVDTLVRIGDPVYYGNEPARRDAAIAALTNQGCRFLVFGRMANGGFETLSEVVVPPALLAISDEVSETQYREDISSTELRRASLDDDEQLRA